MTFWWPRWPFKGQGGILESNGWFHWTQGVKTYRKRGVNIHFSSKNKNSMITSFFRWRPSWIAYCHLMPGFQDGYLIEKCDLGSLVPETIIKLRGPHRVSWVYCQLLDYSLIFSVLDKFLEEMGWITISLYVLFIKNRYSNNLFWRPNILRRIWAILTCLIPFAWFYITLSAYLDNFTRNKPLDFRLCII